MSETRYVICSDGCHEYFVPVGQEDEFYTWVDTIEDDTEYDGPSFEGNRTSGRFTFTDPKNG